MIDHLNVLFIVSFFFRSYSWLDIALTNHIVCCITKHTFSHQCLTSVEYCCKLPSDRYTNILGLTDNWIRIIDELLIKKLFDSSIVEAEVIFNWLVSFITDIVWQRVSVIKGRHYNVIVLRKKEEKRVRKKQIKILLMISCWHQFLDMSLVLVFIE